MSFVNALICAYSYKMATVTAALVMFASSVGGSLPIYKQGSEVKLTAYAEQQSAPLGTVAGGKTNFTAYAEQRPAAFSAAAGGRTYLTACAEQQPALFGVATGDETIAAEEVGRDDMVPVAGSQLKDGEYEVEVDSSSSMFRVVECRITVKDGSISARMKMSGKGYSKVCMGKAEAAASSGEGWIEEEVDASGAVWFTVPVEALNKKLDCAAFSRKKELWYDRTLVFYADKLPEEAYDGSGTASPAVWAVPAAAAAALIAVAGIYRVLKKRGG